MKYLRLVKRHLINYKRYYLNVGNKESEFNYEEKHKNFIAPYQKNILYYINNNNIKLDDNYHHLESLQTMCLNLFYPIIEEDKIDVISQSLDLNINDIKTVSFNEIESDTKIDFCINNDLKKVYFKIKYTEENFRLSKFDYQISLRSYGYRYLSVINKYFYKLKKAEFYQFYQLFSIYLNILINENISDLLVISYPEKNKKLDQEYNKFIDIVDRKLKDKYSKYQIKRVYLERLFSSLYNNLGNNFRLFRHLDEFKLKYLFY